MLATALAVRIISGTQVRELLTWDLCIEAIEETMKVISRRHVMMPLRHNLPLPNGKGRLGMMYGYLGMPESFGIKLLSKFAGNHEAGLSSHMGVVVLYEPDHGRPVAIMEAGALTAIRTAAASAVATRHLARQNSRKLAIIGAGEEATSHLPAILRARPIEEVSVWGRDVRRVEEFVRNNRGQITANLVASSSVEEAVRGADVVCTVTSSAEPVLFGRWIQAGTHVNLVGSSVSDRSEVDTALLLKSRYFVDYRESTLAQAGELFVAKREGYLTDEYIAGEIGEVISGSVPGRQSEDEITIYKSLGVIAQDLAAGSCVLREAQKRNIGTMVEI